MRYSLSFLFLLLSITLHSQSIPLYVGGYTSGDCEGIYQFQFNTETGELTERKLIGKSNNPSYLVLSKKKDYLYAISESSNYKNTKSGAISSYKFTEDGTLEKISELSSNGSGPCHLGLNKKGDKIIASNYGGGNFSLYNISKLGELETANQIVNLNREKTPAHTHSGQFYKNELFVADLGVNTLEHYLFNGKRYISEKSISMVPGSGPRHFTFTKNSKYVYVINEYSNKVTTLKRNGNSYTRINDISTLNDDFKGKSYCADIHLSKNEKFLYGSNRGENTIVVFKRNKKDGSLEKVQNISTHGDWPRNFVLDPSGKFLLVANQKSSNISVYAIHKKTGKLTFLNSVDSTDPSCLKFN